MRTGCIVLTLLVVFTWPIQAQVQIGGETLGFRLEGENIPEYYVTRSFLWGGISSLAAGPELLARYLGRFGVDPTTPVGLAMVDTFERAEPLFSKPSWDPSLADDPEAFEADQTRRVLQLAEEIGHLYGAMLDQVHRLGRDAVALDEMIDVTLRPTLGIYLDEAPGETFSASIQSYDREVQRTLEELQP